MDGNSKEIRQVEGKFPVLTTDGGEGKRDQERPSGEERREKVQIFRFFLLSHFCSTAANACEQSSVHSRDSVGAADTAVTANSAAFSETADVWK